MSVTSAIDFGMDSPQGSDFNTFEVDLYGAGPPRRFTTMRLFYPSWDSLISGFPAAAANQKSAGRRVCVSWRPAESGDNCAANSWGPTSDSGHTGAPVMCKTATGDHLSGDNGDRDAKIRTIADQLIAADHYIDVSCRHEPFLWANENGSQMSSCGYTMGSATWFVRSFQHVVAKIRQRWDSQGVSAAARRKIRFAPVYTMGQFRRGYADEFWQANDGSTLADYCDYIAYDIYSIDQCGGFKGGTSALAFDTIFRGTAPACGGSAWRDPPFYWTMNTARKPWGIWEWGCSDEQGAGPQGAWIAAAYAAMKILNSEGRYGMTVVNYFFNAHDASTDWRFDHTPTTDGTRNGLDAAGEAFFDMAHDPFFYGYRQGFPGWGIPL